jgi:hypothetical protein
VHVRRWLVFLLLGLLLGLVGLTLLGGTAQFAAVVVGVLIAVGAGYVRFGGPDNYVERASRAERPRPGPGDGAPPLP